MLAKEARQKMRISKTRFSLLIDTLSDEIESRPYHLDKRQLVLVVPHLLLREHLRKSN